MDLIRRLVALYQLEFELIVRWRAGRRALIKRVVASFLVAFVALAVTAWVLPGISFTNPAAIVLAVVVLAAFNLLIRPVVIGLVPAGSPIFVAVVALILQVATIYLLGPLVPGVTIDGFWSAFWGSWIFAIVNYLLTTIFSISDDDSHYGALVRQLAARQKDAIHTDRPGLLIVQVDGLAYDVLRQQLHAGRAPFISNWIRSGSHRLTAWEALLPTQTSASQAGILHGNNDGIPAFRWLEKTTGRLLVSNHPKDASEIMGRISNGEGLLSAGGASISNLMSGDARRSYLTMATIREPGGMGNSRAFQMFFISPYNYLHMIVRFFGETFKEYVQAWRQRREGIEPRMHRGWPYPIARAATNVVLRALGTALVVEEMYMGTPVIYIDFTDYDEIAHHSGPERAEALDALDGVSRALGTLEKAAKSAARPYEIVVVSDHGQSLGATFLQRYGKTLQQVVKELMGGAASVEAATSRAEEYGPLNAFLSEMRKVGGLTGRLTRAATKGRTDDGSVAMGPSGTAEGQPDELGPGTAKGPSSQAQAAVLADLTICASGNLGLIYFGAERERMSVEAIEDRYPGLVEQLAVHPGIGLLLMRSETRGAVVISRDGIRYLDEERVQGRDPLEPYGPTAAQSLRRLDSIAHVGDIAAISVFDADTEEVAAFEELIGSHGGLGGAQSRALLMYPAAWKLDRTPIVGAPDVYRQIRIWLKTELGIELGKNDAATAEPTVAEVLDTPETPDAGDAGAPEIEGRPVWGARCGHLGSGNRGLRRSTARSVMARYESTVMVSVVCPWDEHEQLAEDVFRRAIRYAYDAGFRRIYVFGTAGEGYAVDSARFRRVIEVFGDELSGTEAVPMVGVIGLSTANVLERLRVAHGLGFREFQISLPSWSTPTDPEVLRYFQEICGAFPDARFLHYNTGKSGRILSGHHYRPIVDSVPNLVATKTMTSDLNVVASVVREAPELMHFFTEQTIVYGSLFGECALLGTYAGLAPKKSWALWEAAHSGRHVEAAAIGTWFHDLNRDLFDPLFVDTRVDGAYDKTILKLALPEFPLRMLSPYRTISEEEFQSTLRILRERYPDCE